MPPNRLQYAPETYLVNLGAALNIIYLFGCLKGTMDVYTFLVGFRLIRNFYPDMMGMIWVPGSRTWSSRTLVSLEDSRGRLS